MERSGGIPPGSVDIKEGGADRSEKGMGEQAQLDQSSMTSPRIPGVATSLSFRLFPSRSKSDV
jgi:hypothetical protein